MSQYVCDCGAVVLANTICPCLSTQPLRLGAPLPNTPTVAAFNVDTSKYTDLRILNATRNEQPPAGFTVLGVFPGQCVVETRANKSVVPADKPLTNNYGQSNAITVWEDVVSVVDTVFVLVGATEDNALVERDEAIRVLRMNEYALEKSNRDTASAMTAAVQRVSELEAAIKDAEARATRNANTHLASEKLAANLRQQIAALTTQFGQKAVADVLEKAGLVKASP